MCIVGIHTGHLLAGDAFVDSCNVGLGIWQERRIEGDTCALVGSIMAVPADYMSVHACVIVNGGR